MLRLPEFDPHVLDPKRSTLIHHFLFNYQEINRLIEYFYNYLDKYTTKEAAELLVATAQFLGLTDQDPQIVKIRAESQTPEKAQKILIDMIQALEQAKKMVKNIDEDSMNDKLLNLTINYCLKAIHQRLQELKKNEDPTFKLWNVKQLRKLGFHS